MVADRAAGPRTHAELRRMLKEHLYVERTLRVDRHSVRVLTDDDEVELAYFFVDDHVVASEPDRWAYLLHGDWELPLNAHSAREAFMPPGPVDVITSAPPGGEGVTYAVLITFHATFLADAVWCALGSALPAQACAPDPLWLNRRMWQTDNRIWF